jgi:hypothetical protein
MFPERRFLVVEFDFPADRFGVSTRDACASLLAHLSRYAPLVLAVWSGSKSLQGWFDEDSREFFEYACALGADPATWTRCQLVRTPQAIRWNGNRQTVEFFNPSNLPEAPLQ